MTAGGSSHEQASERTLYIATEQQSVHTVLSARKARLVCGSARHANEWQIARVCVAYVWVTLLFFFFFSFLFMIQKTRRGNTNGPGGVKRCRGIDSTDQLSAGARLGWFRWIRVLFPLLLFFYFFFSSWLNYRLDNNQHGLAAFLRESIFDLRKYFVSTIKCFTAFQFYVNVNDLSIQVLTR